MTTKAINNIPLKEADSNKEKMLLGFINQEGERIGWGKIVIELTYQKGKLMNVKSTEVIKTLNFGEVDNPVS